MGNFDDLKIGLVLSGGGAKGAYEAGVLKALDELGLVDRITVVSGTSIGTVNALLLSMNDRKVVKESWSNISYSRFILNQERTRGVSLAKLIAKIRSSGIQEIIEQIRLYDVGLVSQKGVREFINEYINLDMIADCGKSIYACAYDITGGVPEYFRLNDYTEDEIMNIVLASCSIPFIFKPIKINGKKYADGGIKALDYIGGTVDNVPLRPLKNHDCDLIIVVHLSYKDPVDRSEFQNADIVEIFPSSPLEIISGTGGIIISQSMLKEHIEMGYRDAMVLLAPIVINLMRAMDISYYIDKNYEDNMALIDRKIRL